MTTHLCCHCKKPLAPDPLLTPGSHGMHAGCAREQAAVTALALRLARALRHFPKGLSEGHLRYHACATSGSARGRFGRALTLPWFRREAGRWHLTDAAPEFAS